MSAFEPKFKKKIIAGYQLVSSTTIPNTLQYEDDYIDIRVGEFDVNTIGPSSLPHRILKAGRLATVNIKKSVSFISTNLYFADDQDGIISNNPQVITDFNTYSSFYIQPSKNIGTLSFNGKSYDDIYISTNNRVNFVIYYKKDHVDDEYGGVDYDNIVLQIGSTDLNNNRCPMYCLMKIYAQNIGIGWDNDRMGVQEDTVIAAIIDGSYSRQANSYPLEPLSDSSIQYKLGGDFSPSSPSDVYYSNYRYTIQTNTVDATENFKLTYGYGEIDESKINITSYVNETTSDISHTAPDGTLYNSVVVTIPKQECVLDLAKPTSGVSGINPIGKDGTITPIIPNGYLISKVSGKVRVQDVNLAITANGIKTYESPGSFYNQVAINTNVQSIGDIETNLNIRNIKCDKNSLFYDECSITFYLDVYVNENYSVYISTDNNNFSLYSGDDIELPIDLKDIKKNIYYKLKNNIDNTYTSVSRLQIPVEGYLLNAIDIPNIKVERTSNNNFSIYIENIESIDHGFICSLNINDKIYTLNDIDNAYVDITTTEKYINIESYFYKMIHRKKREGKITRLIVDTDSLAVIELSTIEYRDPAYVYSKVPTKYYGVYLTLLKLLSDNGETLLNDCASACKSSSHKLTSLWNMFNAACGAYLNDNKKLADVLIKTITSQLNIMYDENFDFLQHRIFIGNYTLKNNNNPNEFNTVDLYKLTPTEYDVCSDVELTFTIKQTSDIHYIMLPPELDLKYISFGDTIKTVLFDSANNINLYKTRSWRMADKDTDGTIYWYYSPAGAFDDIITVVCKHK